MKTYVYQMFCHFQVDDDKKKSKKKDKSKTKKEKKKKKKDSDEEDLESFLNDVPSQPSGDYDEL